MENQATMRHEESDPMSCAFFEARAALERGEVPAGAVIVRDGA
ncbi:MAG: nucleoside deaminase, partial [Methylocella sp.]